MLRCNRPRLAKLRGYRKATFYTMRTDALDRFGTRLERHLTPAEIAAMMDRCGLGEIGFRETSP